MYGKCMAVKTITIDMEAYERLSRLKQGKESFSYVIKKYLPALGSTTEERLASTCLAVAEDATHSTCAFLGGFNHQTGPWDDLSASEREDLQRMQPGSVIIDVAIDQGGCIETSKPTSHANPTYIVDDVLHYCVTNMPGAVGRTSTYALCNVTLPYVIRIAEKGILAAAEQSPPIARAVNMHGGKVTNRAVAETFDLPYSSLFDE